MFASELWSRDPHETPISGMEDLTGICLEGPPMGRKLFDNEYLRQVAGPVDLWSTDAYMPMNHQQDGPVMQKTDTSWWSSRQKIALGALIHFGFGARKMWVLCPLFCCNDAHPWRSIHLIDSNSSPAESDSQTLTGEHYHRQRLLGRRFWCSLWLSGVQRPMELGTPCRSVVSKAV